jgi:hypothetical protein
MPVRESQAHIAFASSNVVLETAEAVVLNTQNPPWRIAKPGRVD